MSISRVLLTFYQLPSIRNLIFIKTSSTGSVIHRTAARKTSQTRKCHRRVCAQANVSDPHKSNTKGRNKRGRDPSSSTSAKEDLIARENRNHQTRSKNKGPMGDILGSLPFSRSEHAPRQYHSSLPRGCLLSKTKPKTGIFAIPL
jgi:hypothetical protein